MTDRRGISYGLIGWAALAYLEALIIAAFAWVLIHQVSPPVIEACQPGQARVVAPAFDRSTGKTP